MEIQKQHMLGVCDNFIFETPFFSFSELGSQDSFLAYHVPTLEQAISTLQDAVLLTPSKRDKRIQALKQRILDVQEGLTRWQKGNPGLSALHAVRLNDLPGFQLMLWNNEDPNKLVDAKGNTLLHHAAHLGRKDHIQALLFTPTTNPNQCNYNGKKPIDLSKDESVKNLF